MKDKEINEKKKRSYPNKKRAVKEDVNSKKQDSDENISKKVNNKKGKSTKGNTSLHDREKSVPRKENSSKVNLSKSKKSNKNVDNDALVKENKKMTTVRTNSSKLNSTKDEKVNKIGIDKEVVKVNKNRKFNTKEVESKKLSLLNKKKANKENNDLIEKKSKRLKKNYNVFFRRFINKFLYVVLGFGLCFLFLFILCGGKNYFRLYYELREFIEVYDVVTTDYYGELDKNELISGAIDAMFVNINDYYTTYIDKDSADTFLEDVNGTYEGIGCMISTNVDGEIFIVEVFDDSPSSEAGLMEDDIILKVNDVDYSDKTSLDMSEYVKNNNLNEIDLTIKRNDEIMELTIKREKIEIPVVNSQVIEYEGKKVGYISIEIFSSVSYEQIQSKLKKLEKKDISGLVIDVRDNNGGYLNSVTDISSLFLKKGKVIYQLEDEDSSRKVKDTSKESKSYPVAVLVNNGSASASEIFAAAIKESYGGFVVGTNTYGKGTVQKTKVLSDGSIIKYTVQNWLTPKGNFVNEVGVAPTHVVELDYNLGYDNQLQEAVKLVVGEIE